MGKQLMIVDDSPTAALKMESLLKGTEFEIAAYCRDGEEAISKYGEINPDLVTMDIIMPGIDGLETSEAILEEHPEARIVMVSSMECDSTLEEARSIGAKSFVYKPFEREKLISALEKALAQN